MTAGVGQAGGGDDLHRVRMVVAYDGAPFRGFAVNEGVRTVMGDLAGAVATVVRRPVVLTGAGRTDAGVHAWGQVVSADVPAGTDLDDLVRRLNKLCAPAIAVRSAAWAAPDFDARFSATWREYRYDVWNAPTPNPLLGGRAWFVPQPLTAWAMHAACDPLIGEHDFSSFCRRPKVESDQPELSLVRRVLAAGWSDVGGDGSHLRFTIRANAFCHQMVRSIVGTLVDVGLGKATPGDVRGILVARRRDAAGQVAPPHGLVLWEVGYAPAHERS
ncbi:MAG: tRNA pseudouridine(38-40) synthase TruA [Actinomycetota bacterium]|nr:tRNA pseudouridine(38-40) synthase TruA [Acidimicrobiia bacterium]MDQ3469355.1 tRNA pseudouridine(38-40) synthase TruA [Actinomycetota bacterium]